MEEEAIFHIYRGGFTLHLFFNAMFSSVLCTSVLKAFCACCVPLIILCVQVRPELLVLSENTHKSGVLSLHCY